MKAAGIEVSVRPFALGTVDLHIFWPNSAVLGVVAPKDLAKIP